MKKLLKAFAYLFSTLILLLLLGVLLLVTLVKPEKFKPQIVQYVQQTTGRQFAIHGDLGWTFFPMLGIKANDVQLANPANFPAGDFVSVKEAAINVAVRPLWNGEIRLGTLKLDGLTLHLIKNAQGQTNWQDLLQKKSADASNPPHNTTPASTENQKASTYFKLTGATISAIDITDGKIIVDDITQQQHIVLDHIILQSQNIGLTQTFPFTLQFLLQTAALPQPLPVKLQSTITLDLPQQSLYLADLQASANTLQLSGKLQVKQLTAKPIITGSFIIPAFDANHWLASLGKPLKIQALNQVAAQFDLKANNTLIQLQNIKAQVDDSTITGTVSATGETTKSINFTIAVNQFNAAKFINDTNTQLAFNHIAPVSSANAAEEADGLLPLSALRQLNAQGRLTIGTLILPQFTAKQVALALNAKQGLIQITPFVAQIYGGQLQSSININTRSNNPTWHINTSFTHIDINALLQSLNKINALKLSGTGNVSADLTTMGNTTDALIQFLNGNVKFAIQNGILHGIDIPYYSNLADALSNKTQPTRADTKQTPFGNMTGTLQIVNGIVNNRDLLIQAPQMTVTGSGSANLISAQLNYQLQLQRLTSGAIAKPRGPAIPILITGPFAHPDIRPDWQALLISQAKEQIKNQLQKRQQDINDTINQTVGDNKLGKQLQQGLQSLLGS